MSDEYISKKEALSHPFANGKYDKENANLDYILGFESYKEWLETLPTTSILDHARAIKEYCKKQGESCGFCPFNGMGGTMCRLSGMELPLGWFLPEGEKEGAE
jgi:hypothetical protein